MTATRTTSSTKSTDNQSQADAKAKPDVERTVYTREEFCEAHRISEPMYFKLRRAGLGPREMRGMRKILISCEAAAEWRRAREKSAA